MAWDSPSRLSWLTYEPQVPTHLSPTCLGITGLCNSTWLLKAKQNVLLRAKGLRLPSGVASTEPFLIPAGLLFPTCLPGIRVHAQFYGQEL